MEGKREPQPASPETLAVMAQFYEIPPVLEFESWWIENNVKRYVLILFFSAVNQFQVLVDDSKVPLTITVDNPRTKDTMRAWDLHIGRTIDILGRCTTLMAASRKTVAWLDASAKRLWKRKCQLENRVNKFRAKPFVDLDFGLFKKLNTTQIIGGVVDVGVIARCVVALEGELSKFQ